MLNIKNTVTRYIYITDIPKSKKTLKYITSTKNKFN